jgi:hypothetical protein
MIVTVDLSYISFIMYIPSIPWFHQRFYHEGMLNFVKDFFCIYWNDYVLFVFVSVNMLYYI